MKLFDSHAHIGAPELYPEASALMERARAADVAGVIAIGSGYGLPQNSSAVALAEAHDEVWATAGLHPHDAEEWAQPGGEELASRAIDGWLNHERVVAVGECGLDFYYDNAPRDAQRAALRGQIALARRHPLPLVIHVRPGRGSRDAFDEILAIFDDEGAENVGGVIHCFTGDLAFAEECLARGFDISFSGILTFKNAGDLREVARALPLERLLIETDTPLLAPVPHRGRRNEPAFVRHVAECLAEIVEQPLETVARSTSERTLHAFGLA